MTSPAGDDLLKRLARLVARDNRVVTQHEALIAERDELIRAAYRQHYSYREIAPYAGLSATSVGNIVKKKPKRRTRK